MAVRELAKLGEPILREQALPIPKEQLGSSWLEELIDDLVSTMRHHDGAGLAAPQIFESVQVCILEVKSNPRYPDFPEIPLTALVNPQLTPLSPPQQQIAIYEGCLSVPGLRGRVSRPKRVRLQALTPQGDPIDTEWEGVAAAVLQHEVDHLNGTLFVDRAAPKTLCFLEQFERYVPPAERVQQSSSAAEQQRTSSAVPPGGAVKKATQC